MSGVPEFLILRLLARHDRYGYELSRAIRLLSADALVLGDGVLYPALHSLEARGYVRTTRRVVRGRPRIYYSLRPAGRRRLDLLTVQWRRISEGVENVIGGEAHDSAPA